MRTSEVGELSSPAAKLDDTDKNTKRDVAPSFLISIAHFLRLNYTP